MLADIDLDLNDRWVSGPGTKDAVRLIQFKRDTSGELRVRFWSAGVQVELAIDAVGTFGIKKKGEYDGTALVLAESWVKTGTGDTTVYTFSPEFDGAALATLLGSGDGNVNNDEDDFLGMCEIKWIADGKKHRTQTVDTLIDNDVLKDGDGGPPSSSHLWAAPLALTAPPVNGALQLELVQFIASSGITADGTCNVVVTGDGITGSPLTIPVALTTITHTTDVIIATAIINALLANAAFTALWDIITPPSTAAFTIFRKSNAANDATLNVVIPPGLGISSGSSSNLRAGVLGTVATAKGQLAIVTTTNASGTFQDVWTCSNLFPYTWQPPGRITRAPNGTLYRAIVDNTGIPSTEPAYP